MMKQNQERRARADAEEKHVGDQIGKSELTHRVVLVTDQRADARHNQTDDDQQRRDLPPFGKIQRR